MLKVAGGKYRSRILNVPPLVTVPTKNMVREAISNALKPILEDATVLDLFAGSGALGIEMLSRGAKEAYFVDNNSEAAKTIRNNLLALKETNGVVIQNNFESFLRETNERFDIVLLDPPYKEKDWYQKSIDILLERNLLKENSAIVLEYEGEIAIEEKDFLRVRDYKYGRSKVKILWR